MSNSIVVNATEPIEAENAQLSAIGARDLNSASVDRLHLGTLVRSRLFLICAVLTIETLLIVAARIHSLPFLGPELWSVDTSIIYVPYYYGTLLTLPISALFAAGTLLAIRFTHPEFFQSFSSTVQGHRANPIWIVVQIAFWGLFLLPIFLIKMGYGLEAQIWGPVIFISGLVGASLATLHWSVGLDTTWNSSKLQTITGILATAALAPVASLYVATRIWHSVSPFTLHSVDWFISALGFATIVNFETAKIGINGFAVIVEGGCSGIEGMMLIGVTLAVFMFAMRSTLKFPNILILIPIALALAWMLNTLRISILLFIGAYVSPELALDGFHSYAGWILYMGLSTGVILAATNIAWFQKRPKSLDPIAPAPLLQDMTAAQILPFVVFMASSLIVGAISAAPETLYPVRAIALAFTLALFLPLLRRLNWHFDPVALLAGAGIGVVWLYFTANIGADQTSLATMLPGLSGAAMVAWIVFRVVGTTLLVPITEELFFRGYLLNLTPSSSVYWKTAALIWTSALFGALHQNWWLAGFSGVMFGLLAMRRGRVTDAIIAHGVANGIIAAWAVATGDFSVI